MDKKLHKFLNKHRVTSKTDPYTHVGMGNPCGKFNITENDQDEFYDIYSQCVGKFDLHMAEKSIEITPFIIDIDFLQDIPTRKYTFIDIINILQISDTIIKQYYDVLDNDLMAVVLEKNKPTLKNNNYKDGIHIIYPNLAVSKIMKRILLNDIIKLAKVKLLFSGLNLLNDLDNIIDCAVVYVPWLMFGSKKENGNIYYISHYIKNSNKLFLDHIPTITLIKILSIHKFANSQETKLKSHIDLESIKNNYEIKKEDKNEEQEFETAKMLVSLLSDDRTSKYHEWINVGWALKNTNDLLFNTFIEFSKKNLSTYSYDACEKVWNSAQTYTQPNILTIASLHYWAKNDNLEEYHNIEWSI